MEEKEEESETEDIVELCKFMRAGNEDESETEDMVGRGDFRGVYEKNPESKFRKMIKRIKDKTVSDPVMRGKIINAAGGRLARFCADTGCSVNIMPAKMAAAGGLKWRDLDPDEPSYKSETNEDLEIVGQTSGFIKLEHFKTPIRLDFLVCLDEGDEALLCLDTLKDLSIVSQNFPMPMDPHRREPKASKARRVRDQEEEDEWLTEKEIEDEEERRRKQKKRKVEDRELCTLQERVGSLRTLLEMKEISEED